MKRFITALLILTATILISGCSASYQSEFLHPQTAMQSQARVLIVTPDIGRFESIEYPTSGNDVVRALTQELKDYCQWISTTPNTLRIEDISDENLQFIDYVFIPEILHWEDRLTNCSYRPDRIQIRFDIYDSQRQLVNVYLITGRSAYFVWMNRQPSSLLKKPIQDMLKTFFNQQ